MHKVHISNLNSAKWAGFGETSVSEKFEIYSRSFHGSNFVLPVYSSSQIFVFEVGVSLTVKDMTKSQF